MLRKKSGEKFNQGGQEYTDRRCGSDYRETDQKEKIEAIRSQCGPLLSLLLAQKSIYDFESIQWLNGDKVKKGEREIYLDNDLSDE